MIRQLDLLDGDNDRHEETLHLAHRIVDAGAFVVDGYGVTPLARRLAEALVAACPSERRQP